MSDTPDTLASQPTTYATVREAQSVETYNPLDKQKAGAKLSRIPVKVVPGEILKKPGRLPAGRVYRPAVTTLDLAPTFLRLAGAAPEQLAGLSGLDLWPRWTGAEESAPARMATMPVSPVSTGRRRILSVPSPTWPETLLPRA